MANDKNEDESDLLKKLASAMGETIEEAERKVRDKEKELGGIVGVEAAAMLVARENGVELDSPQQGTPETEEKRSLALNELFGGMKSASVVARVLRMFPVRKFTKKDGTPGRVGNTLLGDSSGTLRAVFWDSATELMDRFQEGDTIRLIDAFTKEDNGEVELHLGRRGRVEQNPEGAEILEPAPERKPLSELSTEDSFVEVLALVARSGEPREFDRKDGGKGRVRQIGLADSTGVAKLVLWDNDASLEASEGDTLLVSGAYVKDTGYGTELHLGSTARVVVNPEGESPPEVDLEKARAKLGARAAGRKRISEIVEGELVEVRGTLVDIKQPHEYSKEGGERGAVLTATLDDGSGNVRVTVFESLFREVTGREAGEVLELHVEEAWERIRRKNLGKELVVTGRVQKNDFLRELELVASGISPADPVRELTGLARGDSQQGET